MNTINYHHIFHEIKNSITLIDSSLQLLKRSYPELEQASSWLRARNEMDYLKKIILEVSQVGGIDNLNITDVNINQLILQTQMYVKDTYPEMNWSFKLDQTLPEIPVDAIKIKQAIINLLKNSAEAMQSKGLIAISTVKDKSGKLRIDISDSGGGIPVEIEKKIFQPFYTSKENGTGLGLAITQQIIEKHGGQLLLENIPDTGCTFSILLPMS